MVKHNQNITIMLEISYFLTLLTKSCKVIYIDPIYNIVNYKDLCHKNVKSNSPLETHL